MLTNDLDGRTMTWLARKMGVSRQHLYTLINGTAPWTEARIGQLNQILGTSFSLPSKDL